MGEYYETDLNKTREQMNKDERSYGYFKPIVGKNFVRILPAWNKEGVMYRKVRVHFRVGADNQIVPCNSIFRKRCFICEKCAELRKKEDPESLEEARNMRSSPRYLVNMIEIKNPENGVQIFSIPKTVWEDYIKVWMNDDNWGDITNPKTGYDIIITRTGTGLLTKYASQIMKEPTPIPDMGVLKNLKDLDEIAEKIFTYEQQKEIYYGTPDYEDLESEEKDVDEYVVSEEEDIERESAEEKKVISEKDIEITKEEEIEAVKGEKIGEKVDYCPDFGNFNTRPECMSCPMMDDCIEATRDRLAGESREKNADDLEEDLKKAARRSRK